MSDAPDADQIAQMQPDEVLHELGLEAGHHSTWQAEQKWMRVALLHQRQIAALTLRIAELEKKGAAYVPIAQRRPGR